MDNGLPNRIAVTYSLTTSDYDLYAAAVERRRRSWTAFSISVAALFCAIPVALLFRTLAAQRSHDIEMIDMVGRSSLFSFGLAILSISISASIRSRLLRRKHYKQLDSELDSRTVVLDKGGITVTGRLSQSTWQWCAVTGVTNKRDLFLLWVSQWSAIPIPGRCLSDDGARKAADAFVRAQVSEARAKSRGPVAPSA